MRTASERAQLVDELRRRYLEGTLDEVLIPEDPPLDELISDLFPGAARGGIQEE